MRLDDIHLNFEKRDSLMKHEEETKQGKKIECPSLPISKREVYPNLSLVNPKPTTHFDLVLFNRKLLLNR